MINSLITVVVPVYNVSKYLDRCMDSILNQSYQKLEIILVDDGSLDDCGKKCDFYASKDSRVKVVHKTNGGLGFARNSALDIATGDYVLFIDSDDYVDTRMVERLFKKLVFQKADTCFCRYYDVSSDGDKSVAKELFNREVYSGNEVKELLLGMIGAPSNKREDVEIGMSVWKGLYSLSTIQKYHIRFPSEREFISEDIIFHIDYLKHANRVAIEMSANYFYCDNDGSLTKSYKSDRFKMEKILFRKEREELREIFDEKIFIQRLYKSFMGRVRRCITQEVLSNPRKNKIIKNINDICSDVLVKEVLMYYDFSNNVYSQRVVNLLIQKKCSYILWLLIKIKN